MASVVRVIRAETLKVDVSAANVALLRERGVVCIEEDVVELALYLTRQRVVQRAVAVVNGVEGDTDMDLTDASQLLRDIPGFVSIALRGIRFGDAAAREAGPLGSCRTTCWR